ncbi:MAG: type I glyceraldehyde-3-phosphate dehydrogenase [archaeon]
MKIAINGFGRIGRVILRIALEKKLNVVAINDPHGIEAAEYLIKHDTVYGPFKGKVSKDKDNIIINNKKIKLLSERDINKLPWKKLGVDVVIESTGVFRDRESASIHLKNGAKKVIITSPAKKPDITIVPGVNHQKLNKDHKIISVASCTTNCLTPIVKIIHDNFKIKRALMTTVHAFTNDQATHDEFHKKLRRGRAASQNIIPTTTGAAESVVEIMPELLGKINGLAVRVPVACGSLVDLVAELEKEYSVEQINSALKKASQKEMKGIIEYSEEELVSSDIIGNTHSSVVDAKCTQVDGNLIKVLAWYDNEWGYSNRVIDVLQMISKWAR